MIITTQDCRIEYKQSDSILKIFNNLIIKPFKQYSSTEAWRREVLESYSNNNFKSIREIVGGGQADFDEPFKGLTPEERVLLYCYDGNMQQHTVSQLYIFEKYAEIFDDYLFQPNQQILFIDFGCGPLSSGIALAIFYAESQKSNGQKLNFNYIGIDRAESMLLKAKEFSQHPSLFHEGTMFNLLNPYAENPYILEKKLFDYIDSYIDNNSLIVLNFSYFFASESLDVSLLINHIRSILSTYIYHKICLVFQNPPGSILNHKWELFQKQIPDLKTVINGPIDESFYFYDLKNNRPRETKLYYDIRFRIRGV